MPYVDGYILPIPTNKVEAYREMATRAGQIWREYGALEYRECIAEDVKAGQYTSFPQSVLLEEGETVFFSWIVFASRQERDAINAKVMNDPRLADLMDPENALFDVKRLIVGGFEMAVNL